MDLKAMLAARAASRGGLTEGETNALTSGRLYTWGRNDYGRCGLGDTKHRAVPTRVPDLGRVVKVRGGAGHTLAVTADGTAVAFGKNYLGQLGVGDDDDRYYPHRLQLDDKPAASCSGGGNFSAIVAQSGEVYAMGCGYFHATGQPTEAHLRLPTLTKPGQAARENESVGLIPVVWALTAGETSRFCPAPVPVKGALEGKPVAAIASCFDWNMVIASDVDRGKELRRVWAWGDNGSGQLGPSHCGDSVAERPPYSALPMQIIGGLEAQRIVAISCGNDHGVAVDDKGDVWAWGVGELGQLGFGEECGLAVQTPRMVPFFQRRKASVIVVDVAAAKKHTLYLTQNGQVYVSGDDQFGNERVDAPVNPRQQPHLLDLPFRVSAIGVGGYHSCLVTE
ncbi:regulator of chromosome condensation (RCC1) repeat domain containing protein [Acanthamoeba castellanii str. Neff]|uniref:Regulator of chromosome condensation (RCC1) repeat domain containing protein n=1 Tax=Acanthamoeba castellanii (strain ATCC 30010 / Neff) TaxID=1257118 RepID=L8HC18_ACACF|nr:regulator of chromosome condensation (RCC1) repeat domain containing protein [Acanthamoeba castellanii str. Neff]ELR21936.1 regulator of chromosome condensation (RCC1) repeat domain containing protein [Acanthamoeba castellanii str. Neff]